MRGGSQALQVGGSGQLEHENRQFQEDVHPSKTTWVCCYSRRSSGEVIDPVGGWVGSIANPLVDFFKCNNAPVEPDLFELDE
jgi:hypothetical protein